MTTMGQHAQIWAENAGFAVFPTAADCKPGRLAWEGTSSGFIGVHDATRDRGLIDAYWARYPAANVSVACGAASGVFVLDVDVKDGVDGSADLRRLEDARGLLPRTWRSRTPSGGEHIWFAHPDRELTNRVHMRVAAGQGGEIKTGLDVRPSGGCVPLPPSAKAQGPYAWIDSPWRVDVELEPAPAWLLDIIDPPLPRRPAQVALSISSTDRTVRYVEAAVSGACDDRSRLSPASGRNLRLFQAAANLGELVGAHLLPLDLAEARLEHASQSNGLWREDGARAVLATIRSGLRKGMAQPREVRL